MRHQFLRVMGGAAGGSYTPVDADAAAYITAVEAADTQALEDGVREAIDDFVIGCKADSIWDAIQACCIMAGARTRNGTMVPLKGAAPDQFGTAGGWNYNRETGLAGNGTNNYRDSNRDINADPQNSRHLAVYLGGGTTVTGTSMLIGCRGTSTANTHDIYINNGDSINLRSESLGSLHIANFAVASPGSTAGLVGQSRTGASAINFRCLGSTSSATNSGGSFSAGIHVFKRNDLSAGSSLFTLARISFYSIGESIDLALLDARVTTLMADIAAAI